MAMEDRLDLAVIESRWWDTSNDSVRGMFDMLAGLHCDNPFAYHYEMFNNADALKEIVDRVADRTDIHNIYLAAHGTQDGRAIQAAGGRISRTVLGNIVEGIHGRKLHGLFVGACGFGQQNESVMEDAGLTWIAGYRETIDWIHSSAMDLYFWNAYFQSSVPDEKYKPQRAMAMASLLSVLYLRVPYMFKELGFQVTLSLKKGQSITFDDDDSWKDVRMDGVRWADVAENYIEENPGEWP